MKEKEPSGLWVWVVVVVLVVVKVFFWHSLSWWVVLFPITLALFVIAFVFGVFGVIIVIATLQIINSAIKKL